MQVYHPQWAKAYTDQEKNLFEQGYQIQKSAQKFFSGGISIQAPYWDFQESFLQTQQALQQSPPYIYEACFSHNQMVVRVDILEIQKEYFNIIEVKSSSSVKEDHILDIAIQKYILDLCKCKIQKCFVVHINKECIYPNMQNLFIQKDVTSEVLSLEESIHKKVKELKNILSQKNIPEVEIGPHCKKPYPCRFIPHCWKSIKSPSVFDIPQIGEKSWDYYKEKKIKLSCIPDKELDARQIIYKKTQLSGQPYIEKEVIQKELSQWKLPFYYLDFETLASPVPYLKGTQPFQDIPFQFHCLKQISIKEKAESQEGSYLHTNRQDPRRDVVQHLVRFIQEEGSIIAYYKNFESKQLKNLAKQFPEFQKKLLSIESRLKDPLPLLRSSVCYKEFGSSWSLKSVAPVLLGDQWSYSGLEVQDGLKAQRMFLKMISLENNHLEKKKIQKSLIQYCRQDTWCLALIVQWLFKTAKIDCV